MSQMMRVFYCTNCKKYHYTNKQSRAVCCGETMEEVDVEFTDFIKMDIEEREKFLRLSTMA